MSTCEALVLQQRRDFARNLKKARREAGLTQEQLVKLTGLTQQFISEVETAKKSISLDNAKRIADAVGKPLCKLLSSSDK